MVEVTVLLEYLNRVVYTNEWASIICTFGLSELTQSPMSSYNGGNTLCITHHYMMFIIHDYVILVECAHSNKHKLRLLYVDICKFVLELFSKSFFKQHFCESLLELAGVSCSI